MLLRAGLWSPDRRHSGVADGCGRARQGTRCQGGRGLSLATGPKRRANGFLGTEPGVRRLRLHQGRQAHRPRGGDAGGPTALTPTTVASLRPLGRATTGHFCRSRALIVRCSAVGRTKTKRPPHYWVASSCRQPGLQATAAESPVMHAVRLVQGVYKRRVNSRHLPARTVTDRHPTSYLLSVHALRSVHSRCSQ